VINTVNVVVCDFDLRSTAIVVAHTRKLDLHAIHAVDAVNEQDQDEYERNLNLDQICFKPAETNTVPSCHIVVLRRWGSRR
jgi:hypothetical protein